MKLSKLILVIFSFLMITTIVLTGCSRENSNIEVRGSDTMVNLGQNLAETYMEQPENNVSVSVTGGGSGTGISAMIDGRIDIANSSRAMTEDEIQQAQNNNVDPIEIIIAMDGLAVFVNDDIPVDELTVEEVGAIFRGNITNWSELGGPDTAISLYGRQSNSGTYVYFRENVLKADFSEDVKRMNGTSQIVEGVSNDTEAIGYGGIGYTVDDGEVVEGLKVLNIAVDENSEYPSPLLRENVESGKYPIARPLYNYTNGLPEDNIRDYIEFVLGEKGQETAVESGFYPITPEYQKRNEERLN